MSCSAFTSAVARSRPIVFVAALALPHPQSRERSRPLVAPAALAANKDHFYAQRVGELLTLLQEKQVVLTPTGTRTLGKRRLAGIRVEHKGHPTVHLLFDRDTGLLHRSEISLAPRPDGARSTHVYTFEEYRDFNGLKHFTRLTSKVDEQPEVVWEIRDFRVLDRIDPRLFEKP